MENIEMNKSTRANLRKKFSRPVCVEIVGMAEGRMQNIRINGDCMDMSHDGMCIITGCALNQGAVLKLCFPVTDVEESLPVFTEVVWSRRIDKRYVAGLRFLA